MSNLKKATPWKSQRDGFQQSLIYLKGRMEGLIKSIQTPWSKFNDATTDGLEWHSMIVIGGRPASGKTLIKDQIVREAFRLNPGENFRALEFQFEMLARTSAIREYSSVLGKSYKHLCSAGSLLSSEELQQCYDHAKERVKYPIDIVEEPCTVNEFKEIISNYMKEHAKVDGETEVYTKTIVTLDHSVLLKRAPFEKDKMDTLYNLGEAVTDLKRRYPIIFIILTQLNRDINNPERNEDGKYGNHVLESDIFGADALLQHADTLIGLNRPGKQKIKYYGVERYIVDGDPTILAMHFIKCRNGETGVAFFRTAFEQMTIHEMPAPARQVKVKVSNI